MAAGAQRATLRIVNRLEVPECFEFDTKMRRSDRTRTILIESDVTLRAGADHLEICTRIDNQVRDHRVRVLFESGARTDTYLADSAFDVVERRIALPADNHTYKELAVETAPHANWTAVFDAQRGLAVVAPDLPEAAVRDFPERPLALTLLRGFRRTVFRNDDEPGGQSFGLHIFHYRLVPLRGRPDETALARLGEQMSGGIRAVQVLPRDQAPAAQRTLPRVFGQLVLRPDRAVMTSFRRHPEKGFLEIRLFNPGAQQIQESLELSFAPSRAELVDFEGEPRGDLKVSGKSIAVTIGPKQIVTIAIDGPGIR